MKRYTAPTDTISATDSDRPLVLPKAHGLEAVAQVAINLIWSVAIGHIVRYAYVTFYFLATQNAWVRPVWNTLLDGLVGALIWMIVRHFARAGLESELTSATVWVVVANPFKMYVKAKTSHGFMRFVKGLFAPIWLLSLLKRLHIPTPSTYGPGTRLTWWQWLIAVPAFLLASLPGFAIIGGFYGLARLFGLVSSRGLLIDLSAYPGWLQQDVSLLTTDWQYTLAGLFGTLFYGRLVFKVYAAELMEALARQMAAHSHSALAKNHPKRAWLFAAHKFYPVGYRTAFQSAFMVPVKPGKVAAVMLTLVVLYLAVAVPFGYIVLTKVANKQWFIPGFH